MTLTMNLKHIKITSHENEQQKNKIKLNIDNYILEEEKEEKYILKKQN